MEKLVLDEDDTSEYDESGTSEDEVLPVDIHEGEEGEEEDDLDEEEEDDTEESVTETDEERPQGDMTEYEAPRYTNCVCGDGLVGDDIVWCDMCPKGFHLTCIPPDATVPQADSEWFCPECALKRHHKYGMLAEERKKVLIGPEHQAPRLPEIFFLSEKPFEAARIAPKLIWSSTASSGISQEEIQDYLDAAKQDWPLNMFVRANSPLIHRQLRRAIFTRTAKSVQKEKKTRGDIYTCPFSPDLALSLLAHCMYDTSQALVYLRSRELKSTFSRVCHPPKEPYRNKWHPHDRRWKLHKTPFPGKAGPLAAPDYVAVEGGSRERRYARLQAIKRQS